MAAVTLDVGMNMASMGGYEAPVVGSMPVFSNVRIIMGLKKCSSEGEMEVLLIIGLNLYIPFSECAWVASNLSGGNTPYQQ